MTNYLPIRKGNEVKLQKVETKTVIAARDGDRENHTGCFRGDDEVIYHIEGRCSLSGSNTLPRWEVLSIKEVNPDWPPQENDIWKTDHYTMHFINGKFHFRNQYSPSMTTYTVEQAQDTNPKLIFRADKKK